MSYIYRLQSACEILTFTTAQFIKTTTQHKQKHVIPTVKHAGREVIIWPHCAATRPDDLTDTESTMNSSVYCSHSRVKCEPILLRSLSKLAIMIPSTVATLQQNDWQSQSPDLQKMETLRFRPKLFTSCNSTRRNLKDFFWTELFVGNSEKNSRAPQIPPQQERDKVI